MIEQILFAYGLPTKAMIYSPDGDTDFFNTLASYAFIPCLYYVLQISIDLMKENDFKFFLKVQEAYNIAP